jgi:alpha-glucosidase
LITWRGERRLGPAWSEGVNDSPWWRGAVIYQIYPRSFFDTNADGTGDLKGITAKLEYVASLGVDGVWLSPFFPSPMKDFGYDISDYRSVEPTFGTLADFDKLLRRAHSLGLKVIIDQVYSHSSNEHPWFIESAASRVGPKADWYVWADAKPDGSPPNNWQSIFGGPAWTWSALRRQYYLHNFLSEQPDLDLHSPAVQAEILDIARFWLDCGVDGFRLDVATCYTHDRDLRDNPQADYSSAPSQPYFFQRHIYDKQRPETLPFIGSIRALTDAYPGRMMVGEVGGEDELAVQIEYTDGPTRLHTAYSFFLLKSDRAEPKLFADAMIPWNGCRSWPSWSLGNHDVMRFPTRLGGANPPPEQVNALLAAIFCMRGTIFLYQGEELGLPQAHVPFHQLRDPHARRTYTGGSGRDGARTPFPWSDVAPMAGFTRGSEAWLPVDPAHLPLAVARQEEDPGSHLNISRRLIALRSRFPSLRVGDVEILDGGDSVLALIRTEGTERILCAINLDAKPASFSRAHLGQATLLESGLVCARSGDRLDLPSFGGVLALLSR